MELRPYQADCCAAIDEALATRDDNPLAVLPTGGGKTIVFADLIKRYLTTWPGTRIMVLAHIRELIAQAADKLRKVWPEAPVGVYSAGLGARDMMMPVTIAGIQSVFRKAHDFEPFDLVFVDEAHRIPLKSEGIYRRFLADAKLANPRLRVVGFTATPYRLAGGSIVGPTHILNHICYQANVRELIEQGYLSPVTSRHGDASADVSGVAIRAGEFVAGQLSRAVDTPDLVESAVAETLARAADRKSLIFFCISVEHAQHVAAALARRAIEAPVIHAKTPDDERERNIRRFDRGEVRALCNVNVLSEGFDSTRIDCIVMLRPTASAGLYMQQVGRGLRLHPGKVNCLVLDFAGNVERHGPIDQVKVKGSKGGGGGGPPPVKICPKCNTYVLASSGECSECGYLWPANSITHDEKPSEAPVISTDGPQALTVQRVTVAPYRKEGKPTSLKVTYHVGLNSHSEWVCLEHDGYARRRAQHWWRRRFGDPVPATVQAAMADMFLAHKLTSMTERIEVRQQGKFTDITQVYLKDEALHAIAR